MGKRFDKFKKGLKEFFVGKDEVIQQIEALPDDVIKGLQEIFGSVLEQLPEMKAPLEPIDTTQMEQMAMQQPPGISPVQLPAIREGQQFDFAPIEAEARRGFEQQTIPGLAERFAGQGALKSSAFTGELGRAGSDLEKALAALKSKYNLQREGFDIERGAQEQKRGFLGEQLGQSRAQLQGALGAQRFGHLGQLANLGLQQRGQELDRRQLLASLLGIGANRPQHTMYTPATQGFLSPGNLGSMLQSGLQTAFLSGL